MMIKAADGRDNRAKNNPVTDIDPAVSVAESIICDKQDLHVVFAKNKGAAPFMDDDDVVKVLCRLGKDGIAPQRVNVYNEYIIRLMRAAKAYEKLTVRVALTGDRDIALAALIAHPLTSDIA